MIIYLEATLNLIAKTHGSDIAQAIITKGKLKQLENINYIILNT